MPTAIGIGNGISFAGKGGGSYIAPSTLLDGLVSYWKMDEASGNRLDSVGSNNLTPNAVTSAPGKIGNAAVLSSAGGSYMSAAGPSVGAGSFTVAGWYRPSTINGNRYILNKNGEFALAAFSNQLSLQIYASGGNAFALDSVHQTVADTTYFVCGTYNRGANLAKIRVNAFTPVSQAVSGTPSATANALFAGAFNTGSIGVVDGWIDEIGIWNRVLTDLEIDELYNGGAGKTYPF